MAGLTYRDAGVDTEAGDRLVERIKPLAMRTRTPEVLGSVGGFAGLCSLPEGVADPVLVSGTDGVGTKLDVARRMDRHDTIGIDLVAMCVNDILTVGARPLFFLDYFVTGELDVDRAERVIGGIARGCEQAGCALLGGETAEHPGFHAAGEYDLAGFAVGVVDRASIVDGTAVREGHAVLGLASSGLHSNGYSLARRALLQEAGLRLDEAPESLDEPLGDALLRPTRIYARAAAAALEAGGLTAMCHVTGGGLPGNVPRVLPDGLGVVLDTASWPRPPIFELVRRAADIDEGEMRRTFNLGLGFVLIVEPERVSEVLSAAGDAGAEAFHVGRVERSERRGGERVRFE